MEFPILGTLELKQLLTVESVINIVEKTYGIKTENKSTLWNTIEHHFADNAIMDIRSGYLSEYELHGFKVLNNFPRNRENNQEHLTGILNIFDSKTGYPLGIADASYITSMRTGAAAAIGAKYLAKESSSRLLIIGAGKQAPFLLANAIYKLPNLKEIYIYDPLSFEQAAKAVKGFPQIIKENLSINNDHVEFKAIDNLPEAVNESDIIFTLTPSREPLVRADWITPGTHISSIGADMVGKIELEPDLLKKAVIYCDDIKQCVSFGELEIGIKTNVITKDDINGEIGEIIIGKERGRLSEEDITVFDATGLAFLDIAVGGHALEMAQIKNIGTKVIL